MAVATLLVCAGAAQAATYTVSGNADAAGSCAGTSCTSLRAAVGAANTAGGSNTITLGTGSFSLTLGSLDVASGDALTVAGAGASQTTIDGSGNTSGSSAFVAMNGATSLTLDGLTLDGAGAGVSVSNGGAINTDNGAGAVTIEDSVIQNGAATNDGGALYVGSTSSLTITDSTISHNTASGFGGAIYDAGSNPDDSLTITDSTISNNTATSQSGGAVEDGTPGQTTITGSTFDGNTAGYAAGALDLQGNGPVSITNSTLNDNTASGSYSGAINATAGTGAASASLMLANSTLDGNHAANGGAVTANDEGGVTITNSTFDTNSAVAVGSAGGALNWAAYALTVSGSTFSGNSADYGGAIWLYPSPAGAVVQLTNSTLTNNQAATAGGAIDDYAGSDLALLNDTLFANTAPSSHGGGIASAGLHSIENTIVAGNGGGDCNAAAGSADLGNNLDGDGSCFTGDAHASSDKIGVSPLLAVLNSWGGPTQTMALTAGSPAIDAGNDAACPATDQRGVARPQGSHCDIGAYERAPPMNKQAPTVSGTPVVGAPLVCLTGSWAGAPTVSYGYEWLRDGVAISGATTADYTATTADANHSLSCTVTAQDVDGSASVSSASVSVPYVSNAFVLPRLTGVQGGTVALSFAFPVAGSVSVSASFTMTEGKGKHKHKLAVVYGTTTQAAPAPGTVTLELAPSAAASNVRKADKKAGKQFEITVAVTFTPAGGITATQRETIVVLAAHRPRHHR